MPHPHKTGTFPAYCDLGESLRMSKMHIERKNVHGWWMDTGAGGRASGLGSVTWGGQSHRSEGVARNESLALTEVGGLHGVVKVLGCPGGHAVWASQPWGQRTASGPVRAGCRSCLMPENIHQSSKNGRWMGG